MRGTLNVTLMLVGLVERPFPFLSAPALFPLVFYASFILLMEWTVKIAAKKVLLGLLFIYFSLSIVSCTTIVGGVVSRYRPLNVVCAVQFRLL